MISESGAITNDYSPTSGLGGCIMLVLQVLGNWIFCTILICLDLDIKFYGSPLSRSKVRPVGLWQNSS